MQVAAISNSTSAGNASAAPQPSSQSAMLMDGLGLSSILWALLSATPVRLLEVLLKSVRVALAFATTDTCLSFLTRHVSWDLNQS